jgi:hypothetical protein
VDIRKTIIATALVFANIITPALALRDYKSLKGIKELAVVVASIDPEAEKEGLTKQQIQTDVELKLRMEGIKVAKHSGAPYLFIQITAAFMDPVNSYVYNISLDALAIGVIGRRKMVNFVRDHLKGELDRFINDYFSVNPIQAPTLEPKKQL